MKNSTNIQFKLKGVELIRTVLNPPVAGFTLGEFQFDISIESKIDPSQKRVFIINTAEVRADNKTDQLAVVSSVCIFGIENADEIVNNSQENQFEINDEIMHVLISISISTLRGIMFEQFRGTHLHTALLPIVDTKQFNMQKN